MAVYQPISSSSGVLNGGGDQLYFAGRPVSYGSDRLGSKRADSPNMQGQTIAYTYFPYGEEYTTTTQDTDKFGTYFRDSTTALDYARNRYYSNRLARFLTVDSGRADLANPQSFNRYAYASGDPINRFDPRGKDSICVEDAFGPNGINDASNPCALGSSVEVYSPIFAELEPNPNSAIFRAQDELDLLMGLGR